MIVWGSGYSRPELVQTGDLQHVAAERSRQRGIEPRRFASHQDAANLLRGLFVSAP